jgi:hypothetical protein
MTVATLKSVHSIYAEGLENFSSPVMTGGLENFVKPCYDCGA